MTTYGQKDGEGFTRGKKLSTLEATFLSGVTAQKRAFFSEGWMTWIEREGDKPVIQAWENEQRAQRYLDRISGDQYPVQMLAPATRKA